jgi:hypothetical protein
VYEPLDWDDRLSKLIVRKIKRNYPSVEEHRAILRFDGRLREELAGLMGWFGAELMKICKLNSVSSGGHHLAESEAFLGVIVMPCDRFQKRRALSGLLEQTSELFGFLKSEIVGSSSTQNDEDEDEDESEVDELDDHYDGHGDSLERGTDRRDRLFGLHRAFVAWTVATHSQSNLFGTHSFGLISLGILLNQLLD